MNKILVSIFSFLVFLAFVNASNAAVSCQPIYGGGQTCVTTGDILVNKKILLPSIPKATNPNDCRSSEFVDNLGVNDQKFSPNQLVTFQICLTNTGGATILQTSVKDVLPKFVNFVSGAGNFDPNTKTLTFTTDSLNAGETRSFILQARVVDSSQLSAQQTVICDPVNQVTATTNTGQVSNDLARFCIENKVLPATTKGGLPIFPAPKVTTTPATGPELIPLMALLPGGIGGYFLRRFGGKK